MGGAIATRLAAQGWDVVGWTRSGRASGTVKMTGDPNEAVAQADLVLLALFDGPACQKVLDDVRDSLRTDTIVLNTSTIAPAEATRLARQLGPSYVHAPLLGPLPTGITVHLDAGYDSDITRALLDARGLQGQIAHKGEKAPVQATGRRQVERTHAWQNAFRRLARCYER